MAYQALNNKGKAYIRTFTDKAGDGLLKGKHKHNLPNSTLSATTTTFQATVTVGTTVLTTNKQLGDYVIVWLDKYAKQNALDANILAAQMGQESKYTTWAYSTTGALGLTQFTPTTIADIILIRNRTYTIDRRLTTEEVNKIMVGLIGDKTKNEIFTTKSNRKQLHQNVINNPEIMIKMQCMLMAFIGKRNNNLASSSLFAYNRGSSIISNTYLEAIKACTLPIAEGIKYVREIYSNLVKNFGYPQDISSQLVAEENGMVSFPNPEITQELTKLDANQTAFINDLHWLVKFRFQNLIEEIQKKTGYKVLITSGYRSFQKQLELSEENQHNAEPGKSHHNYGLAIDINLIKGKEQLKKASSKEAWIATGVPALAKELGFSWGGDYLTYHDPVHFDLKDVYDIDKLVNTAKEMTNNDLSKAVGNRIPLYA